jgi:hypothetical protein
MFEISAGLIVDRAVAIPTQIPLKCAITAVVNLDSVRQREQ